MRFWGSEFFGSLSVRDTQIFTPLITQMLTLQTMNNSPVYYEMPRFRHKLKRKCRPSCDWLTNCNKQRGMHTRSGNFSFIRFQFQQPAAQYLRTLT